MSQPEQTTLLGFLAGYRGHARDAYTVDLRPFTAWCWQRHHRLLEVRRVDIECFARDLEDRGKSPATVARRLCTIVGFYRYAEEERVIEHSPAVQAGFDARRRGPLVNGLRCCSHTSRGSTMPKYLLQVTYTLDGVKGVVSKGGSARKAAAQAAAESVGGTLESFYFAFGGTDVFAVGDLPDNAAAAALALNVTAAGGATVNTVVLLSPEEIDGATQQSVVYTPPGA